MALSRTRGFGPPSLLGGTSPFNGSWPHVEIEENDNEIRLIAEVPGVDLTSRCCWKMACLPFAA